MTKIRKAVLAYSGGLDTSAMLLWIKETYGCEVVCYTADVGQGEELTGLDEKAKATGASKLYVEEHGDGDPLLLIEGLGQAMWAWREQVPVFARQFRAITFDGHYVLRYLYEAVVAHRKGLPAPSLVAAH